MSSPRKVTCVGAGNVGRAWAIKFAMSNCQTVLYDVSIESLQLAQQAIQRSLCDLEAAGTIACSKTIQSRITTTTCLSEALSDAIYVQESVPEDTELKKQVFQQLDQLADSSAVIGSSTSEIPASDFCAELIGGHRCLVAHPLNPPYLIPLVELCPAPFTSEAALAFAQDFFIEIGHKPIVVKKEVSGFIANRLQLAVLAEAVSLVKDGACSATDIDTAMKHGLARRWLFFGPFETAQLNCSTGFKDYISAFSDCHRKIVEDLDIDYSNWTRDTIEGIDRSLSKLTPQDEIQQKQASRDQKLMALNLFLGESGA